MTATSPSLDSVASTTVSRRVVERLRQRVGLLSIGMLVAVCASALRPSASAPDRRQAVVEILQQRGFAATADDVVFMDGPRGVMSSAFSSARLLVRASAPGPDGVDPEQPNDIFLLEAKLSPGGALLDLSAAHNLSETTGADETRPVMVGDRAVYASNSGIEGAPSVVTILDFSGQPPLDWPLVSRAQNAITNWQQTGRLRGVGRKTYVVQGNGEVSVARESGEVVVATGAQRVVLPLADQGAALPGWITLDASEVAQPGNLVTWAVDRVRFEVGDENMQAFKQVFFEAKDFFDRNREELTGATAEADIADDMGEDLGAPRREIAADPDLGWPPAPLEPWVTPALPGEGQWNAKEDPAFFRSQPNLPPTFLTTFIRSDKGRKTTRVYIALWDPRQVELHMMAGTVEPKGATGKAGPGLIPRTPEMMKRVVAATNAGFQALHGEFGMMADGVVYLPPKPFAATVMRLRDGSTAFGTWPRDPTVPDQVVSYRQNMTVMVQDEQFNPYNRTWWGGTVPGSEDKTHTVRTGICLTKERFVAYFYGADLSPEALAQSMIQARCSYGLALDMNAGHSGMEFYRVAPSGELPTLSRGLETSWEAEGNVPDMPGWEFRSKRLIKGMGLMNFPRYIKREARDYFYLTLRHVLPGENLPAVLSPAPEGDGVWRVKGLPQHGFPYALAISDVHPDKNDASKAFRVLALDPRTLSGPSKGEDKKTVLTLDAGSSGEHSLWLTGDSFALAPAAPDKSSLRLLSGSPKVGTGAALVCVHPESHFAYYAEASDAKAGKQTDLGAIAALMTSIGCNDQLALAAPLALTLGDGTDLAGQAAHPPRAPSSVRLVRRQAPAGVRFFEDTPIVPRDEWYRLQAQRVRYFKKHD